MQFSTLQTIGLKLLLIIISAALYFQPQLPIRRPKFTVAILFKLSFRPFTTDPSTEPVFFIYDFIKNKHTSFKLEKKVSFFYTSLTTKSRRDVHANMAVTVLCNNILFFMQKFKSLVEIFKSQLFFSSTQFTLLVFFIVVVLLLSKWIDFSNTWDGTTNARRDNSKLDGTRLLLSLALPFFSVCRSMIFHTKSTGLSTKLGPKLVSSKKKRSETFGRPRSLFGSRCRSLLCVPLALLVLSQMPLNVDGLDEVAMVKVKLHVRLLREVPKNEFQKNSTNTSNDVFQPLLLQQPHASRRRLKGLSDISLLARRGGLKTKLVSFEDGKRLNVMSVQKFTSPKILQIDGLPVRVLLAENISRRDSTNIFMKWKTFDLFKPYIPFDLFYFFFWITVACNIMSTFKRGKKLMGHNLTFDRRSKMNCWIFVVTFVLLFHVGHGLDVCSWSDHSGSYIVADTYSVPEAGCKMKQRIFVNAVVTIEGVSGSFRVLQSNRVDDKDVTASDAHRHFQLESPGKLTLNYLKLTWGEVGSSHGGFIYMQSGTLAINWVHFDGTKTTGMHANSGGCIYVLDGNVTIKESTGGGAMHVHATSTPMTIESTTFKNNEADVRFIFSGFIKLTYVLSFILLFVLFCNFLFFVTSNSKKPQPVLTQHILSSL